MSRSRTPASQIKQSSKKKKKISRDCREQKHINKKTKLFDKSTMH